MTALGWVTIRVEDIGDGLIISRNGAQNGALPDCHPRPTARAESEFVK
ncbi:hypothetical protein [Pararhizobium sp.]